MKQGVRAALIAVNNGKILLVRHVHPDTAEEWWVPPGGALEDADATVQACVAREVREETGLHAVVGRLIYFREFRDSERNTRWVELYFLADALSGELTAERLSDTRPEERYVREARWVARAELEGLLVFPQILRDHFWQDHESGFPAVRYLGVSADAPRSA